MFDFIMSFFVLSFFVYPFLLVAMIAAFIIVSLIRKDKSKKKKGIRTVTIIYCCTTLLAKMYYWCVCIKVGSTVLSEIPLISLKSLPFLLAAMIAAIIISFFAVKENRKAIIKRIAVIFSLCYMFLTTFDILYYWYGLVSYFGHKY